MSDEKKKKPSDEGIESPKTNEQKRLFKKKRAGVVLTEDEVREIREGRKRIRKELRDVGIKSRKDFELTASSMGLYFDKRTGGAILLFLKARWLWALIASLLLVLTTFFVMSLVTKMKGHFTINLTDDLFREGFSVSESSAFTKPSSYLYSTPLEGAMCISMMEISEDVLDAEGYYHGGDYFAYTFYIRNDGKSVVDYEWDVSINSESKNISQACWVMIFEDDEMTLHAEAKRDGMPEILPPLDDNLHGYPKMIFGEYAKYPEEQFETIETENSTIPFYRVISEPFKSETVVATGRQFTVKPMDVHKYTVVLWIEGDDPDCTNDLIGGHFGLEMNFKILNIHEEQ
ncbi:MAG: hypothetical protein IJA86_06340 [Clostridia bacterium]|nr:hypothetical protein [Clostridia bacterium]